MKSFSNETLNFFLRKFWTSYILDLAKTVRPLQILSEKSNFKNLLKMAVLKEHLNKTNMEKVG